MLMGFPNGVMIGTLIVDAFYSRCRCSLNTPTPVNDERTRSRAYVLVVGGGFYSNFDEPNSSPSPSNIIPPRLYGTNDRKTQGPQH